MLRGVVAPCYQHHHYEKTTLQKVTSFCPKIIDCKEKETRQIFFSYVCNDKKIKELFVSTLNEIPISVRRVSSMIVV